MIRSFSMLSRLNARSARSGPKAVMARTGAVQVKLRGAGMVIDARRTSSYGKNMLTETAPHILRLRPDGVIEIWPLAM